MGEVSLITFALIDKLRYTVFLLNRLVDMNKEALAREELLREHSKGGKFRVLASGKGDFYAMQPEDVMNYRNSLNTKLNKKKKK